MRKILSFYLLVVLFFTGIFPVSAALENNLTITSPSQPPEPKPLITYPVGEEFVKLKSLIEMSFSPKNGSQYSCIAKGKLCPNYKYTSIVEKAIKLIILKTYTGNEKFYADIFQSSSYYNSYDEMGGENSSFLVQSILNRVPKGTTVFDWKTLGFGRSLGGELLDASFGVDFSENKNTSSMLGALEQKIQEMKRMKCQRYQGANCYGTTLSNIYLPTPEELAAESIYFNRSMVNISTLADEFEYVVNRDTQDMMLLNLPSPKEEVISLDPSLTSGTGTYMGFMNDRLFGTTQGITYVSALQNCMKNATANSTTSVRCTWNGLDIYSRSPAVISDISSSRTTYTLRYKKEFFTLEEAKSELEKKVLNTGSTLFLSIGSFGGGSLSCESSTDYSIRSQCTQAKNTARDISTALGAYYADTETYPDVIDKLDRIYIPKPGVLDEFKKNFEYKNVSTPQQPNYEIHYIGKIGENVTSATGSSLKRDYMALLSGATIPEIPSLFAHIPSDSMVLYVRDPANLLQILDQKNTTSSRISGVDTSESIRKFLMTFFELDNYDQIRSHLKNEMAIVVNNLDATAPDIVVMLSEADRAALSPTAQARVVGSKDGYIFIANSKESLERFTGLTAEKSMKNAPDFQYVWWKKSGKIRDAFMFVGDEFFEKMTTLETYLAHYRKYRDYARVSGLQELVWAYTDAFGNTLTSLTELGQLGLSTLTGEVLDEYSIVDGLVVQKNIGSLKSLKPLPESNYDFSRISRTEIEDYKINILKYRDIWRASLDPMGIVLNRYGDGVEVDFFMTPIPHFDDQDLREMQGLFSMATKDSLSFITNPRIRMGLASFVFGFDVAKVQRSIASQKDFQLGFDEFSREVLDGKNIFDYIGGEFAFSLGGIDADILDGWNVEKVDLYGSVQVASEEKGKELIDMIRTKVLSEFDNSSSNEMDMMKGFLAKPLIEDYNTRKIYYVEGLPIPFIGKIGFAYTFIDDFFIIGLNRSTIRKVIDVASTSDTRKAEVSESESFAKGTVFATLFDGVRSTEQLKALYEKNKTSIPRYMRYLKMGDISNDSTFRSLLSTYYITAERNQRLGIIAEPFEYTLGALSLHGDTENITVSLDEKVLATLTGTTLQTWDNLRSETDFPKDILTEKGISLEVLLSYKNVSDLASFALVSHLDRLFANPEPLFQNTTFGLNLADDEIGFTLRIFRNKDTTMSEAGPMSKDMIFILSGVVGLMLFGGLIVFLIYGKRKDDTVSSGGIPVSLGASLGSSSPAPVSSGEFITVSTPELVISTPVVPVPLESSVTPVTPASPGVGESSNSSPSPIVPDAPVVLAVVDTPVMAPVDTVPEESSPIIIPTESPSPDIQK